MPPADIERRPRKRSALTPLIGLVALLILVGGAYWTWNTLVQPASAPTPEPIPETPAAPQETTYASSTMKFSLRYPQGFTLVESYSYTRVSPTKPISGVKFTVPAALATGTNLAGDSGVSMELLPRANNCTGDIYLKANVRAQTLAEGARTFSLATSTETAGSDTYEEMVYAIPGSSPCIAMRYFIHTTSATGTATSTQPFNRAAVLAAFDNIRVSLSVQ